MNRRSFFGLALLPLASTSTKAHSFLAPGHVAAEPALLSEVNHRACEALATAVRHKLDQARLGKMLTLEPAEWTVFVDPYWNYFIVHDEFIDAEVAAARCKAAVEKPYRFRRDVG